MGGFEMTGIRQAYKIWFLVAAALVFTLAVGCTTTSGTTKSSGDSTEAAKDQGPVPLYYDFGDVLVPAELKIEKKDSFVFKTPGLAAGVLVLKGNVDMDSLIAFFNNNMTKDNWETVTSFKSQRTIMMFKKDNRWCVINITDKDFSTHVEIWVAPTMAQEMGGLTK